MALGPEGKKEANVTVDQTNGSKGRNGRDRGGLTQAEAHRMCERLLEFGSASVVQRFHRPALMRRGELKANPTKVGEFLFLAIWMMGDATRRARCRLRPTSSGVT